MNRIIKIGARYQYLMSFMLYVLEQEKEAEGQEE